MHDPDAAMRNIARYTEAGVKISIDDFGAGLSSLDYLKRIRAHELKLDKSFTETLTPDSRAALLVRTGIELAHGLGMSITAEGVETAVALETLATMGCDHAQGYHIGRPQPPAALISQLRSPPTRASA